MSTQRACIATDYCTSYLQATRCTFPIQLLKAISAVKGQALSKHEVQIPAIADAATYGMRRQVACNMVASATRRNTLSQCKFSPSRLK
eukprot:14059-Heterococcus_DN1.PRE.3